MDDPMCIRAVAANFRQDDILKKYRPLRRVRVPVYFDLVYYPYFLVTVQIVLKMRLIREKMIEESMAVSGVTSEVCKIYGKPEYADDPEPDSTCGMILPAEIGRERACSLAEEQLGKTAEKRYGHPFRPKLCLRTEARECVEVYKPFWVVYGDVIGGDDSIMVVDAVTGEAGVPESRAIKKIWLERRTSGAVKELSDEGASAFSR